MMTCPSNNRTYTGNCESCNERVDCMLRDITQKLQTLETSIGHLKTNPAS